MCKSRYAIEEFIITQSNNLRIEEATKPVKNPPLMIITKQE